MGCASLAGGAWRFARGGDARASGGLLDLALMAASALVALAGGMGVLRGDWRGRWLLAFWMGAHIVLSLFHSLSELLVHALLFTGLAFLLYRRSSSAFLRATRAAPR